MPAEVAQPGRAVVNQLVEVGAGQALGELLSFLCTLDEGIGQRLGQLVEPAVLVHLADLVEHALQLALHVVQGAGIGDALVEVLGSVTELAHQAGQPRHAIGSGAVGALAQFGDQRLDDVAAKAALAGELFQLGGVLSGDFCQQVPGRHAALD
ncbi:hypothetical protein D3C85_1104870 [compost metagenome]